MIRVCLFGNKGYGFDVIHYEDMKSESGWYNSLLEEDLIERIGQGDIVMYFDSKESAEDWFDENKLEYEFVESDDNS
jgi:hypothetical protein